MRGTGGNLFYPHPMSEDEFIAAVRRGLKDLREWGGADRPLDLSAVTIETDRVNDKVCVTVTADLPSAHNVGDCKFCGGRHVQADFL